MDWHSKRDDRLVRSVIAGKPVTELQASHAPQPSKEGQQPIPRATTGRELGERLRLKTIYGGTTLLDGEGLTRTGDGVWHGTLGSETQVEVSYHRDETGALIWTIAAQ
jgi:hypothetical protein